MMQIMPHVNVAHRYKRGIAKWKELFNQFFNRVAGIGREFTMWTGNDGWKKFKKTILRAISKYSDDFIGRHQAQETPLPIEVLASDLEHEIITATTEHTQVQRRAAEEEAERVQRLGASEERLGLQMPGRGVSAPLNLGFRLTRFQAQGLAGLGQNTMSPGRAGIPARANTTGGNVAPPGAGNIAVPPVGNVAVLLLKEILPFLQYKMLLLLILVLEQ